MAIRPWITANKDCSAVLKNIFANYLGLVAVSLAPVFAMPWYLSELGSKQFGLIGFISMLQAFLGLLDAGMSQALIREITVRFEATDGARYKAASLLLGFERIYWVFALCAGLIVAFLADTIAVYWLNLDGLPVNIGREAVYGAAAIFAVQFPGSIYRTLLVGGQAHVALNSIIAISSLFRHVGGVLIVILCPTLSAYLIWHVTITLLETLIRQKRAWNELKVKRSQMKWDSNEFKPIWHLAAGMSGATFMGALTVQMDRIFLSKMVSIEQFGYYILATTVAQGMLQLLNPLTQVVLPRAVQIRNDPAALSNLSIKWTGVIALAVGLGAMLFIIAGKWLLGLWLRSLEVVEVVYPILALLLTGAALNAFYNVGYVNWLAHQNIRRVLQINVLGLVLALGLIPLFVSWKGTIGAAIGWLTINLIGFLASLEWLKWKFNERSH